MCLKTPQLPLLSKINPILRHLLQTLSLVGLISNLLTSELSSSTKLSCRKGTELMTTWIEMAR